MKHGEIVGGVVVFLFGALTALLSAQLPLGTLRMAGAGLFPLLLGVALMALSAFQVGRAVLAKTPEAGEAKAPSLRGPSRQMLLFMAATMAATAGLPVLGYPLASFFLMAALLFILGVKRPVPLLAISILTAVGCYLLFVRWLKIPLPKGLWGF